MMSALDIFRIGGKKAFVTGGAQGIGKEVAIALAEAGADVAIVDLDLERANQTAREISGLGVKSIAVKTDVTQPDQVDNMIKVIIDSFGTVDIAVNNAGIFSGDRAEDISSDNFVKVIQVNLTGIFLTAQAAGRVMIHNRRGSIINTASMSGHIVNTPQTTANYNASKAGVIQLTKSLAVEWARYNVRVNCISPGYINTELTALNTKMHPVWVEKIPQGRLGQPSELKGAYLFFASDASSYATGSDLIIDGGYTSI